VYICTLKMEAVGSFEAFVNLYPEDGGFVILRDNLYNISIRIYAIGSFENVSTFALIAEAVGFSKHLYLKCL
jgi:hypothetical protein